jgi:hypothetical protein
VRELKPERAKRVIRREVTERSVKDLVENPILDDKKYCYISMGYIKKNGQCCLFIGFFMDTGVQNPV